MAGSEPSAVGHVDRALSDSCGASDVPDSASSSGSGLRHDPAHLLSLWEGHQTTAHLQAVIGAQRREAHMFNLRKRAVLREVRKTKKAQTKIRGKTAKLSTQDLLRELEFRVDHKAAVAKAAAAEATSGSSSSSSSQKPPKISVRRGQV